jgi:hypothetical protein
MLGRFLRTHPEKDRAIILDHASNIERLGFPDDDLPQELDQGERGTNSDTRDPDEPQPWNCPNCHHLVPPRTPQCPVCGHIARRQHEVEVKKGALQKLTNPNVSEQQNKQDVYSQLVWFGDQHGYATGWAKHKYRELFGVWPRNVNREKKMPSQELLSWIRSRQIAYAKRKEN